MNLNLALPYDVRPSPPNDPALAFYSRQSEDLMFSREETIQIHLAVGFRNVGLSWTLARNGFKTPFRRGNGLALPANRFRLDIQTEALMPGFYDLRVEVDLGNRETARGICTFGFRVTQSETPLRRPDDFVEFWMQAKRKLDAVLCEPAIGEGIRFKGTQIDDYNLAHAGIPGDYDPEGHRAVEVEAYKVSFRGLGDLRIHGYLAKPTGNGPFPGMLVLPGAGFNARPMPLEHARHGNVALDIQVHGQEVDLASYPRLPGYYDGAVYEPVESYYYFNVYLNCIQALNYLWSRPDVDRTQVVAVGGSQGGRLALVLAALDRRITAVVAAIVNGGNVIYNRWAAECNAALTPKDGMDQANLSLEDSQEARCLSYYDPMNFAPEVHCPVLMNAGLIDPVSPPSEVYPIFQHLGPRQKWLVPLPGVAHDWSSEFDRCAWRWLDRIAKSTPQNHGDAVTLDTLPHLRSRSS